MIFKKKRAIKHYAYKNVYGMSFGTHIEIDAPVEKVWQSLIDIDQYPDWNPFTPKTQATFEINSPIVMHVRLFRKKPKFLLRVTETVNENVEHKILGWRAHQITPFLFNSKRNYMLEDLGNQKTRLSNTMRYEGLLFWLIGPITKSPVLDGFEDLSLVLKARLENNTFNKQD